MIREVLTQGVVKEFQRSISIDRTPLRESGAKNSPRYGLMAGRNHQRFPSLNWIYVFIGLLLLLLAGSFVFHPSSAHSTASSNNRDANKGAVQVAYLSLKITDLQEKVLKTTIDIQDSAQRGIPSSLPNALADLKRERTTALNALSEITNGLNAIALLLSELNLLGKEEFNAIASNPNSESVKNNPKGDQSITSVENANPENDLTPSDPLIDFFEREEIRNYIKVRENRGGIKNFMGVNATYGAIGHACVSNKPLLERYMDYDIGEICRDDWVLAQQLIIRGCDPLPRRRCRARGPKSPTPPLPLSQSLWATPSDANVRWEHYFCKSFACLADYKHRKKFFKCSPCFDLLFLEPQRWVVANSTVAEYLITDVLALKPQGELRIGLDYSMGTGTFAARMKEHNITIVSATLNLGAPFSETIALRGLVPLYISINQRLPFFDNTLDIVHTTLLLDAWIDQQLLDFILFDFDRVLRPGGLLWLDRFFCSKEELVEYLFYFKRLRYKVHKWIVLPKTDKGKNEVYFSAVWEKPLSPFQSRQ